MNKDILKGNWKQVKGMIKKNWSKITDDEVNQMEGDYDILVGKVQEKYGYKKEQAREKVNDFMKSIEGSD
jgi:uncharacterized protein YjbJ (UPF0337 family)